jgi:signal recognition particle subunit SRP54
MTSMTLKERRNPILFKKEPNRKLRVTKGSGRKPDELNKMLSE